MTVEQRKHRRRIGMCLVCTILSKVVILPAGSAKSACAPDDGAQDQVISAISTGGAVQDSSGRQDVTWLESAFLDYQNGHWLIHFLHSTRAPASQ